VPGVHNRLHHYGSPAAGEPKVRWISPIVRTKDGVALADALEMGETSEGRFGSLF
jgi:hypothetical protein